MADLQHVVGRKRLITPSAGCDAATHKRTATQRPEALSAAHSPLTTPVNDLGLTLEPATAPSLLIQSKPLLQQCQTKTFPVLSKQAKTQESIVSVRPRQTKASQAAALGVDRALADWLGIAPVDADSEHHAADVAHDSDQIQSRAGSGRLAATLSKPAAVGRKLSQQLSRRFGSGIKHGVAGTGRPVKRRHAAMRTAPQAGSRAGSNHNVARTAKRKSRKQPGDREDGHDSHSDDGFTDTGGRPLVCSGNAGGRANGRTGSKQGEAPKPDEGIHARTRAATRQLCSKATTSLVPNDAPLTQPLFGTKLDQLLKKANTRISSQYPPGTRVWVKMAGYCQWPGVMWSCAHCRRWELPSVLTSMTTGCFLVRFYGEHSSVWCTERDLSLLSCGLEERLEGLRAWARKTSKSALACATIEEVENSEDDPAEELRRMASLEEECLPARCPSHQSHICSSCVEEGAEVQCQQCQRSFHAVCLLPPALTAAHLPVDQPWMCPWCGAENKVGGETAEQGSDEGEEPVVERMGLTPDWIIDTTCFHIFGLPRPSPEQPYIAGLLDPCTNSKLAPNIPAEKLYDKRDNGLKLSNPWAGYYVLLNPDFSAQIQWRFVNRAIDEVENDRVPAVLLVCRNSTDTAYFQRLRPYPRVLLRRSSARFKDYDKSPIGFGIAVFAIAKVNTQQLFERFYESFAQWGEPNIPIDKELMRTAEFAALLERLRGYAERNHRDHWVQCSACNKWRIVPYDSACTARDGEWTCKELRPPYSSCATPQSKVEMSGVHYAIDDMGNADGNVVNDALTGAAQGAEDLPADACNSKGCETPPALAGPAPDSETQLGTPWQAPLSAADSIRRQESGSSCTTSCPVMDCSKQPLLSSCATMHTAAEASTQQLQEGLTAGDAPADAAQQHLHQNLAVQQMHGSSLTPYQPPPPKQQQLQNSLLVPLPAADSRQQLQASRLTAAPTAEASIQLHDSLRMSHAGVPSKHTLSVSMSPSADDVSPQPPAAVVAQCCSITPSTQSLCENTAKPYQCRADASACQSTGHMTAPTATAVVPTCGQGLPSPHQGTLPSPALHGAPMPGPAPDASFANKLHAALYALGSRLADSTSMQALSFPGSNSQARPEQGNKDNGLAGTLWCHPVPSNPSLPPVPHLQLLLSPRLHRPAAAMSGPMPAPMNQARHSSSMAAFTRHVENVFAVPAPMPMPAGISDTKGCSPLRPQPPLSLLSPPPEGLASSAHNLALSRASPGHGIHTVGLEGYLARQASDTCSEATTVHPQQAKLGWTPTLPAQYLPPAGGVQTTRLHPQAAELPLTRDLDAITTVVLPSNTATAGSNAIQWSSMDSIKVACRRTLQRLLVLPTRSTTRVGPEHASEGAGVLTGLELARQARIAANRAFLVGLGLKAQALHDGVVPPLPHHDPLLLQAARDLANKAALATAQRQESEARRLYVHAVRERRKHEVAMLLALQRLKADEENAEQQLETARVALKDTTQACSMMRMN